MPEFQAREPQHQQWKQAVLAGEIELEEIDLEAHKMRSNQTPTTEQKPRTYDLTPRT
jgi:lipase chaperone LimK